MPMTRARKEELLEQMKDRFERANAAFLTEYRGTTVDQISALRSKVREGNGELKVLKNRIARIATKGTIFEGIADKFKGPVAIAFSFEDPVPVAKAIVDSLSDTSPLVLKSASLDGKPVDATQVKALSKLPDRNVLLSMMLSAIQGPIRNFACVMAAVPRDFVNVLTAVKAEKEKQS
jgi:large subunit ribosomal protein L10